MRADNGLPLAGVRVLDLADGGGAETASRLLADLGADVIRVEPPGGARARRQEPRFGSISLYDATHNVNKRAIVLDLRDAVQREAFLRLTDTADIVVTSARPGAFSDVGCDAEDLLVRRPELVVVSITDFGRTGPYRDWVATEAVHLAMSGVLSRSGLPEREPLLPPGSLATESAAAQAAWATLVAYTNKLDTGRGDLVDVSIYEATARTIDPGYGIGGSATGGVPAADGPRGRPDARHLYPMFRCADGWVRICVLAPRQWHGMFTWLGEPEEFADPALAQLGRRFAAAGTIHPAIGRLFAPRTRAQIMAEGERHGVPTAALLAPADVLGCEQFSAREAFVRVEVTDGVGARMPNGLLEVDGRRAGVRMPAPGIGAHTAEVLAELDTHPPAPAAGSTAPPRARPLAGLRVLDLGVIVVGAETGRLFADMGAEVIKVENKAFPDGSRQSFDGSAISAAFAMGHRNKLGLGLSLRTPEGIAVFKRLVAHSDVVLSNFKPGTMASLGLGHEELAAVNPRIVVADSSAFGPTGPWSRKMGYGPLVRASAGLSGLWRYPDDDGSFSDASTIYPDHVAARIEATAVLAKLIERRRTGRGGTVSVAQAEIILGQLAAQIALESMAPGSMTAVGNSGPGDAPRGLYPCAGDDEWCAITVRDDADWDRLARLVGDADLATDPRFATADLRVRHRDVLDAIIGAWSVDRPPRQATSELQAAGVPAGTMQRVPELLDDPHLVERGFLRTMTHPHIDGPIPTENAPAIFGAVADPPLEPAPLPGEHSRQVLQRVLGMTDAEIDDLVADGVVEMLAVPHHA
jgi:crotonobetainyl-CoA:carnitine CoA-transferase CaiB-like acyl-CoA transferase